MPNLTPIALTEEEHQRLTTIKHKLEANSWREMLMKLCDLYDQFSEAEKPITPTEEQLKTIVEEIIDEKLKQKQEKGDNGLAELLRKLSQHSTCE